MTERQHTIVCIFEPTSPRLSAYDIHEWIFENLQVDERVLTMIQIDATKRHVYLKFTEECHAVNILQTIRGPLECRHSTGETSKVRVEIAGMGTRRVRIANLPPEVPERTVRNALGPYGDTLAIQDEQWSSAYRYTVANGIKVATVKLNKHIPSHLIIAGHRTLISYDGQPTTCYRCGETRHNHQQCRYKRRETTAVEGAPAPSWAQILVNGPHTNRDTTEARAAEHEREPEPKKQQEHGEKLSGTPPPPDTGEREADREDAATHRGRETHINQEYTTPPEQHDMDTPMEGVENGEGAQQQSKGASKRTQHNNTSDQESENEDETGMVTDDNTDAGGVQKDVQPTAHTDPTTEGTEAEGRKSRDNTRPKKIRLEANSDRHLQRKRSRVRNSQQ